MSTAFINLAYRNSGLEITAPTIIKWLWVTNYFFLKTFFSCVYKCVCKQWSERLYKDLFDQITSHLEILSQTLQVCYIFLF